MTRIVRNTINITQRSTEIQVKRVNVTHDWEKLTNRILSDIDIEVNKVCQTTLPWKDDQFWKELPLPQFSSQYPKQKSNTFNQKVRMITSQPQTITPKMEKSKQQGNEYSKDFVKKVFDVWRLYTQNRKDHKNELEQQLVQQEKIKQFLQRLKELQNSNSNTTNAFSQTKNFKEDSFKHRFRAQQNIIQVQKQRLKHQEKIIQALQLGKFSEELNQSIKGTEDEIRDTLAKCSVKVKTKMVPTFKIVNGDESINFQVNAGKAPKILQKMEERAAERERKRQMILEKKRLMDQIKRESIQKEIEEKKVLDEQERRRRIKEIKEKKQKELEEERKKQIIKKRLLANCKRADDFYNVKLIKFGFNGFLKLVAIRENNKIKSEIFFEKSLKKMCWNEWRRYILRIDKMRNSKAEDFFNSKLKKIVFKAWYNIYTINIQNLQAAEDLYELQLQSKLFLKWHTYHCEISILENKNLAKAQSHYNKQILLHYLYLWKLFPTVKKLEKAKEQKKRKWREKVWEVLPDYTPTIED